MGALFLANVVLVGRLGSRGHSGRLGRSIPLLNPGLSSDLYPWFDWSVQYLQPDLQPCLTAPLISMSERRMEAPGTSYTLQYLRALHGFGAS